jgi:hypothetical protein
MFAALSLPIRTVQTQAAGSGTGANAPERLYILGRRSQLRLELADQDLQLQAPASNIKGFNPEILGGGLLALNCSKPKELGAIILSVNII